MWRHCYKRHNHQNWPRFGIVVHVSKIRWTFSIILTVEMIKYSWYSRYVLDGNNDLPSKVPEFLKEVLLNILQTYPTQNLHLEELY